MKKRQRLWVRPAPSFSKVFPQLREIAFRAQSHRFAGPKLSDGHRVRHPVSRQKRLFDWFGYFVLVLASLNVQLAERLEWQGRKELDVLVIPRQ